MTTKTQRLPRWVIYAQGDRGGRCAFFVTLHEANGKGTREEAIAAYNALPDDSYAKQFQQFRPKVIDCQFIDLDGKAP